MVKLVINDEVNFNLLSFNQNISKNSEGGVDAYFGATLDLRDMNENTDLTELFKDYLEENSIFSIKIYYNEQLLYTTAAYGNVSNISFGSDFNSTEGSEEIEESEEFENIIYGFINFESH